MNNISNNGERLVTETFDRYSVEHLHRYAIAMSICRDLDILDIASGEGYGSNLLAKDAKSVVGVDISEDAILHAKAKYISSNLNYVVGSADRIPIPSNSVDRVISFETLEHHSLHDEMFSEVKRVMRAGGLLMMSTPDKLNYSDVPKQRNEFHVKELYLEEFRKLAHGYFKNVVMLFQDVGYYGLVAPEAAGNYPFCYYVGDFDHVKATATLPRPVYTICLASDVELPINFSSVYSGQQALETMLQQLDARVTKLQSVLDNAHSEIRNLTSSPSYQVGRAITSPYRMIRDVFKRY